MRSSEIPFAYTFIEAFVLEKFFLQNRATFLLLLFSSRQQASAQSTSDNRNENLTLASCVLLAVGENYDDNCNENSTLLAARANCKLLLVIISFIDVTSAISSRQVDLNLDTNGSDFIHLSCLIRNNSLLPTILILKSRRLRRNNF